MTDNTVYLFAGYTVLWLLSFGYLLYLGRAVRELRREIKALRSLTEQARRPTAEPDG